MTKDIRNKSLFIDMVLKYNTIMYKTPCLSNTMGLNRVNKFLQEPYEQIAKRDLLNLLNHNKFEKNTLISSFLDANPTSKIITKITTNEKAQLGFLSEISTVNLLSNYTNVNAIIVGSDKIKNATIAEIKKSLENTNQRMGDFYVDLSNQSKYFDIKHGNMLITNNNSIQEFTSQPILNKALDEETYIKYSKKLFQGYNDNILLQKDINLIINIFNTNLTFIEKLNQKNDVIFDIYKKGYVPGFNPSLHFLKPDSPVSEGSEGSEELELKQKLSNLCPNIERTNSPHSPHTEKFLKMIYKLERELIKENIKKSIGPWNTSFLDDIDTDIFSI